MFTGIIEELGRVRSLRAGGDRNVLTIEAARVLEGTRMGDSISVNGVCLTVTGMGSNWFSADVMPETFRRTGLGGLRAGASVNLERALALGDRLGGHLVSGHIDGTGRIATRRSEKNAVVFEVDCVPEIRRYVATKGSVAVDGISLTVGGLTAGGFWVSIIPHTLKATTLGEKGPGDTVNIEVDVLARYIERLMTGDAGAGTPSPGTWQAFLKRTGFAD